MANSAQDSGLLSGIRVVEAATMVMVPSVGAVLADYGAEVIKIEPLEGDLNRRGHHIPGMPIHARLRVLLPARQPRQAQHRARPQGAGGARHRAPAGRARRRVPHQPPPEVARAASVSPGPSCRRSTRASIYAHGTGFGDAGEEIDKPGFDSVCYWSRSGDGGEHVPDWRAGCGSLGYGTGDHPTGMALFSRGADGAVRARAQRQGHAGVRARCSRAAPGRTR